MRRYFSSLNVLALVLSTSIAMSSIVVAHDEPPSRPRPGYVYYYQPAQVRLVFNVGLGVYRVDGHPNCYYHEGRFYRVDNGVWMVTTATEFKAGKWKKARRGSLPPGLAKQMG
jgi:hypothetical protein